MALDVSVGMFLCVEDDGGVDPACERLLADVNATLRLVGLPEHREPRTPAEIGVANDPCGLSVRLGFYGAEKYSRVADFARHLAVCGAVPPVGLSYDAATERRYDGLGDRRLAFDHVVAAMNMDTVVVPQPFDEVVDATGWPVDFGLLVSAHRLRVESVALGYVFRYTDSPGYDWISGSAVDDESFARLGARVEDDPDVERSWANEAHLCHRLLSAADNILRSGALGVTG